VVSTQSTTRYFHEFFFFFFFFTTRTSKKYPKRHFARVRMHIDDRQRIKKGYREQRGAWDTTGQWQVGHTGCVVTHAGQ
jgi:uncharacterized membrane protein